MDNVITQMYSQSGGDLPYFAGKHQYGGSWLRTLARFAFPIVKKVIGVGTKTAEDVIEGRKTLGQSLVDNTVQAVANTVRRPRKRKAAVPRDALSKRR